MLVSQPTNNMWMEFKRARNRYYVRLVDDLGFLHHVGPANLVNISACAYILGFHERKALEERFRKSLKGRVDDVEAAEKIAWAMYMDGYEGLIPRHVEGLDVEMVNKKSEQLMDRMELLAMRYHRLRRENTVLEDDMCRRIVQAQYRKAPEEIQDQWMEELRRRRDQLVKETLSRILGEADDSPAPG